MKKKNIGQKVLEGLREIKSGKATRRTVINIPAEIKAIRENMDLSQAEFADCSALAKGPCRNGNRAGASRPARH